MECMSFSPLLLSFDIYPFCYKELKGDHVFSNHSNKHTIQESGEYLDQPLGRRKFGISANQQASEDILGGWGGQKKVPPTLYDDSYTTAYVDTIDTASKRRYPRNHGIQWDSSKMSAGSKPGANDSDYHKISTEVLAKSQRPPLAGNPWKYSYKAKGIKSHLADPGSI
eukprot:m.20009 g.20009  ORF g.20009 m.20009 type:complete len:168 (+) comp27946_c0_seq1:336-839(+)